MILAVIHGFASTSKNKVDALRLLFPSGVEIVGIDYDSYSPKQNYHEIIEQLRHLMRKSEQVIIIVSSLGGLYGSNCAYELKLPMILINPVVNPYWQFSRFIGSVAYNYRTMKEDILIDEEYCSEACAFSPQISPVGSLVLVGEEDTVVLPDEVIKTYENHATLCIHKTDHRFELSLAYNEINHFVSAYR